MSDAGAPQGDAGIRQPDAATPSDARAAPDARVLPDAGNFPPVAVITAPTIVGRGTPVSISGASSYDTEGAQLTYSWSLEVPAGSAASLTTTTLVTSSFTPDVLGTYRLTLVVHDGQQPSPPRNAQVAVQNQRPVAVASGPSSAVRDELIALDSTGSVDPDGEPLFYEWVLEKPAGSTAQLTGPRSPSPTFTTDLPGAYRIKLTVNDGHMYSWPALVDLVVPNNPPVVSAGADQVVLLGTDVAIAAVATDADDDPLTITWQLTSAPAGSTANVTGSDTLAPRFVPDVSGEYLFELSVTDGFDTVVDSMRLAITEDMDLLGFDVIDAEYSRPLDRMVMVSDGPARLHIYDPEDRTSVTVTLPTAPRSVSIEPTGARAVVGHDGWVSVVDLVGGTVDKTVAMTTDAGDVVFGHNGYVYGIPRTGQWERIRAINLATDAETLQGGNGPPHTGTKAKLNAAQNAIYGATNFVSPSDIERYDISGGNAMRLYDSPYHGDYFMCGDLWMSQDGGRIFTRCGNVFRAHKDQARDMTYAGSLSETTGINFLDHSAESGLIAVMPSHVGGSTANDRKVQFYGDEFLLYQLSVPLPQFYLGDAFYTGHGRFVFWNNAGTEYYVIATGHSSAAADNDFAVIKRPVP